VIAASVRAQTPTSATRAMKQSRSADDKTPLSLFPLTPVWTLELNNVLTAPPAFRDKYAVFALEDDQLAAYDLENGERLWLSTVTTTVQPAIGGDLVFVATEEALIALSLRTGASVWTQPFDDELAAAPVVAGDRLVLTSADGDVIARQTSNGSELWRRRLPRAASSPPSFTATRLFVPTADGAVVALDIQNGTIVWSRRLGGPGHDILAADDRIFLGAQDRFFYCLNTKNGDVEWRWPTGADAIGLPVADERTVYFTSLDNVLRGLNRSSGVQRWKSALQLRPIAGPLKYLETLVVAGTTPVLEAYSARDGKAQGRYSVASELAATPHLFTDRSRVFPVLTTMSTDIVGRATVTGATRDAEPAGPPMSALPGVETVPAMPSAPQELEIVSALPNLTPVVPAAGP
jgi:outer membrane protein assembly factor BamB